MTKGPYRISYRGRLVRHVIDRATLPEAFALMQRMRTHSMQCEVYNVVTGRLYWFGASGRSTKQVKIDRPLRLQEQLIGSWAKNIFLGSELCRLSNA